MSDHIRRLAHLSRLAGVIPLATMLSVGTGCATVDSRCGLALFYDGRMREVGDVALVCNDHECVPTGARIVVVHSVASGQTWWVKENFEVLPGEYVLEIEYRTPRALGERSTPASGFSKRRLELIWYAEPGSISYVVGQHWFPLDTEITWRGTFQWSADMKKLGPKHRERLNRQRACWAGE